VGLWWPGGICCWAGLRRWGRVRAADAVAVCLVEHAYGAVHGRQGVQAGSFDAFQCRQGLTRVGFGHEAGGLCLRDDSADVMGDEVMQILGEFELL